MKLIGNNITIRDFEYKDLDAFHEFSKNSNTALSAGWKPHENIEISRNVLMSHILSDTTYAIINNENNKFMGTIELCDSHIRERLKAFEIGFALMPNYVGYGYAKEACQLLMEFAFKKKKADVIEMCHKTDNARSEKTINSLGLTKEGIIRKYKKLFNNDIIDVVIYSITKEEYERNN